MALMSSLQPLEKVVHDCCFFAEVRDSFCQSGNSTKHCNPLSSEKEVGVNNSQIVVLFVLFPLVENW